MSEPITVEDVQSRIEAFLANIAGMDGVELPEPQSRVENWLALIVYKIISGEFGYFIVDETSGKKYKLGMRDGKLFVEEVQG